MAPQLVVLLYVLQEATEDLEMVDELDPGNDDAQILRGTMSALQAKDRQLDKQLFQKMFR